MGINKAANRNTANAVKKTSRQQEIWRSYGNSIIRIDEFVGIYQTAYDRYLEANAQ